MRRMIVLMIVVALAASGCATAGARPVVPMAPASDRAALGSYVAQLPIGSRVRVDLADGQRVRGTLMHATADMLLVSPATRLPEPPVEVTLANVLRVELDHPGNVGKTIVIGVAAGVAGTFAVLLLLFAIYGD